MAETGKIDPEKLTNFSAEAFVKMGVSEEDALITARILVAADLRGIDSHGVAHLDPFYLTGLKTGRIKANPDIEMFSNSPSTAIMDGDQGLGFVVGHRAMTEAIRRAKEVGSGFVSVRNSTHFGAGGYYAMMALTHDMIGISCTQGGKGAVAPGSRGRGIGLNVLSVAVPAKREAPFVLDMATSVVAGGKLEIARRNKASIPEGWAVDMEGNPVTDPDKATGGILPLGGTPKMGSFKGFGLTVFVDILCSVLSGGLTSPEKEGGREGPGPNHFFGAVNIDGFMPPDEFKQRMDNMIKAHHDLPKAPGVERIYLAGEIEEEIKEKRLRGIPLHPDIIISLKKVSEEMGVEYNL
ncbi:Ldh family oxidoreductase [Chloroflexota bacterium]